MVRAATFLLMATHLLASMSKGCLQGLEITSGTGALRMRVSLRAVKRMAMANGRRTNDQQRTSTKANSKTTASTAKAFSPGRVAIATTGNMWRTSAMGTARCFGSMEACIEAIGAKVNSMVKVF